MKTSRPTESRPTKKNKKKKVIKRYMQEKLALTFGVITVALLVLSVIIFTINADDGEAYSKNVLAQRDYSSTVVPFRRGTIMDRNKTVLATSERVYNLILDPKVILSSDGASREVTIDALVQCYGYDRNELEEILDSKPESSYVRYQDGRGLSEDEKNLFLNYKQEYNKTASENKTPKIVGVWYESEYKRIYPMNELACTVLGFSASDPSRGNWGIEEYYNDELVGINGREYGYVNTDGVPEREIKQAVDGNTIVSTIDYTIQQTAESYIKEYLSKYDADNVGVIVMDPNNGEILAMATDKSYNLNDPTDLSAYYTDEEMEALKEDSEALSKARAEIWKNFTVQDAYEPGSTVKPITVSAGLEENLIHPEDTYICEGSKVFGSGGNEVTVHCNGTHLTINLEESLMYSCNVAMMDIADTLGYDLFSKYLSQFGFGKQTNIDLPGESPGLIYDPQKMGVTDLATNSFGQNYNVTMVQVASAISSIINGGSYYQPHVVKQILNADGEVIEDIEPILVRETVSQSTCDFIKQALFDTVETGTGSAAAISGYSVGGKTGTAQKHPRELGQYLVSFVGFAPAEDPQVLVYVIVDNPQVPDSVSISAGIAIEIERQIMEKIIPYLNIPYRSEGTVPETQASLEETKATEAVTGEDGNMIPASASASYEEVVPGEGYIVDPTDSGENLNETDPGQDPVDPAETTAVETTPQESPNE